jgi:hypothetical protein
MEADFSPFVLTSDFFLDKFGKGKFWFFFFKTLIQLISLVFEKIFQFLNIKKLREKKMHIHSLEHKEREREREREREGFHPVYEKFLGQYFK